MKEVTATGQTVEKAIQSALKELNLAREDVDVRIIDEGKKGFLGVFGQKPAIVNVKCKKVDIDEEYNPLKETISELFSESTNTKMVVEEIDPIEKAYQFLTKVIEKMNINAEVRTIKEGKTVTFFIEGEEQLALVIGKRGQTLNSLQYLTQLVANRYATQYLNIVVDAENYRQRRKETLHQLAKRMADKSFKTSKDVAMEPMPSYERKVIHAALVHDHRVKTASVGADPHRYIVISPSKK
ncbi:RNA-binding cell elongation regulator Jag/EloR [Bacillus carboniphilus]|uniref:RNA-binding protein KhpB n=1 Tax=Bacillus carboniphilus TaxID=86663 RepID=A0ABY9JR57_9BACI|nr:RNA-binding cell elongation regulator Jag/EloR [Bacillus carboniphilus]WLR41886.1 RNA-binding cell elongation regulator Jag/EloR [Bacillus carboniphilus]